MIQTPAVAIGDIFNLRQPFQQCVRYWRFGKLSLLISVDSPDWSIDKR